MLDVITMVSESTPVDYVRECRQSIAQAAALCPFPLTIIESAGVPGHIGQAMANSLERSRQPYVCWVDDDDAVLPNAFACLAAHLAAQPTAICAREIHRMANGTWKANDHRHHLTAFRRDIVSATGLTRFCALPNLALHKNAGDGIADERSWVYLYRVRVSAGMQLRAQFKRQESLWLA